FNVIAYPGETFHGKVVRIANEVEKESRTLEVRIETDNGDGRLKPGMFADVEITTDVLQNVLIIPDAAPDRRRSTNHLRRARRKQVSKARSHARTGRRRQSPGARRIEGR